MALTGYDPSAVSAAIGQINSAHQAIITALVKTNQATFVDSMVPVWGSPEAKSFFSSYKTTIDSMATEVSKIFKSVVDAMNGAANSLAMIAGSTWAQQEAYSSGDALDVSGIQDNIGGVVGIDLEQANAVVGNLSGILSAVNAGLQQASNAVSGSGFVGGEMQSSLVNSLNKIQTNISDAFTQINTDVNSAIESTVNTYTTTTGNISTGFSGS